MKRLLTREEYRAFEKRMQAMQYHRSQMRGDVAYGDIVGALYNARKMVLDAEWISNMLAEIHDEAVDEIVAP